MRNKNIIELLDNLARTDTELARLKNKKLNTREQQKAQELTKEFYKIFNIEDFTNKIKTIINN